MILVLDAYVGRSAAKLNGAGLGAATQGFKELAPSNPMWHMIAAKGRHADLVLCLTHRVHHSVARIKRTESRH